MEADSTKEKILKVAARHFAEYGYEGARMDRIAEEAQVNKASIYYNIGKKGALYGMVLNDSFERGFGAFYDKLESDMPAEKKLAGYVNHIARSLLQNPIIPKIMMREQINQGRNLPESFANKIVKMLDGLTGILEQGEKEGVFDTVDTLTIHFMILGTMLFQITSSPIRLKKKAFENRYKPAPEILPQSMVDQITKCIIRAVKKEK